MELLEEELELDELEDVAAFVTGGEGSGMNGSRVGRGLMILEAHATGCLGDGLVRVRRRNRHRQGRRRASNRMLGRLATGAGAELPEEPVTAYATAAINATAAKATNGSRRREDRSERIDCRNSIMALPSRRRA